MVSLDDQDVPAKNLNLLTISSVTASLGPSVHKRA